MVMQLDRKEPKRKEIGREIKPRVGLLQWMLVGIYCNNLLKVKLIKIVGVKIKRKSIEVNNITCAFFQNHYVLNAV